MTTSPKSKYLPVKHPDSASDSFLSGNLGLAIYYCCLSRTVDPAYLEKAQELLFDIVNRVNQEQSTLDRYIFSSGLAGLAYVAAFLQKENYIDFDLDDLLESLEDSLFQCAKEDIAQRNVDFLHEGGGVLHYFSYRLDNKKVQAYTRELVRDFIQTGVRDELGFRHLNRVSKRPKELYDSGLAHGMSGLLMVLANIYQGGCARTEIEPILREGLQFMLATKREALPTTGKQSRYPSFANPDQSEPLFSDRLAWCYGDLNILLCLYRLYPILQDPAILREARALGQEVLQRKDPEKNGVHDAHFCHGAAGVAQIYQAIYRASGEAVYQEAYEHWIDITRNFLQRDINQKTFKDKANSLLEGIVGAELVLLSHDYQKDLNWEQLLLLA